jgi:hypothetical protein
MNQPIPEQSCEEEALRKTYKPVALYLESLDVLEYVDEDSFCLYEQVNPDLSIIRRHPGGRIIGFRLERFSKLKQCG